jgi:natural product biosynthesis luciferase-like monooxygenase protein
MKLSISFFGTYPDVATKAAYDLMLEACRRADRHGFIAAWFPERHFDPLGALSPNPALLAAAVSRETTRLRLRAGSVVLPLHHPVRVAEEWAMVDQLSDGRVEVAFASGWHAQDFVLMPDAFADRKGNMWRASEEVRALWRGEALSLIDGEGERVAVKCFPRPIQAELPVWFTALGDPATFREAACRKAGVLTNLIQQDATQLAEKIALYRSERAAIGLDPASGRVAVLMHCFVAERAEDARALAEAPLARYLESTAQLAARTVRGGMGKAIDNLSDDDRAFLFGRAVQRYINKQSLIGSPEQLRERIEALTAIGVDEIACFVDFGLAPADILRGIDTLARHADPSWVGKSRAAGI